MYTYQQVPCFMVLLHLGFSCLLLFTTSAFMHVLRDIFGDVLGLLMLALWGLVLSVLLFLEPCDKKTRFSSTNVSLSGRLRRVRSRVPRR